MAKVWKVSHLYLDQPSRQLGVAFPEEQDG